MQVQEHDLFGFVPTQTQCENCSNVVMLVDATITKHTITETWTEEEHYCSDQCAKESWQTWRGVPE